MRNPTPRCAALAMALALALLPAHAAPARLLFFGEQHDQPDQQRQVAAEVQRLAARGELAAVVLEMAEQPQGTAALPRDASAAAVREALQWKGWPWEPYAPVVMNAVRAAMADSSLDALLDDNSRALLAEAVRVGHCDLLPSAQQPGMVRIQIARDQAMARVAAQALRDAPPGSAVLLLAGAQHVSRDRGVPLHLGRELAPPPPLHVVLFSPASDGLRADERRAAEYTPQEDHCAALRKRLAAPPAPAASTR